MIYSLFHRLSLYESGTNIRRKTSIKSGILPIFRAINIIIKQTPAHFRMTSSTASAPQHPHTHTEHRLSCHCPHVLRCRAKSCRSAQEVIHPTSSRWPLQLQREDSLTTRCKLFFSCRWVREKDSRFLNGDNTPATRGHCEPTRGGIPPRFTQP